MSENKTVTRWWEFYFIRYAMGTVVGAAIVFYLFKNNDSLRANLLFPESGKIDVAYLILLGIYGLTYCYIASAPILVFHAVRYQFESGQFGLWKRVCKHVIVFVVLGMVSLAMTTVVLNEYVLLNKILVEASILFLLLYVVVPLYYFSVNCLLKPGDVYEFYIKLSAKRVQGSKDFIESYKHLREHGNSFGIVLCEITLGFILFMGGKPDSVFMEAINFKNELLFVYAGIIFIWTLPAALVWLIATSVERSFVDAEEQISD